jgi:hypothetical protein
MPCLLVLVMMVASAAPSVITAQEQAAGQAKEFSHTI